MQLIPRRYTPPATTTHATARPTMRRRALAGRLAVVIAVFLTPSAQVIAETPQPPEAYGRLLAKYVSPAGVDYAAWKAATADVDDLRASTKYFGFSSPGNGRNERLAFYINAYNAWMILHVLDAYPVKSVTDIAPSFGVFSRRTIQISGNRTSLNELEKDILIGEFQEPRIHFAINCASRSCPPLLNKPYSAESVEDQLEQVTRAFASSPHCAIVAEDGKSVALSSIFDWYADDFKASGGPVAFLNRFRETPIPAEATVSFQEYDWSLNSAEMPK